MLASPEVAEALEKGWRKALDFRRPFRLQVVIFDRAS